MRSLQDIKYFQLEPELIGIIPAKGRPPEMCVPIRLDQVPSLLTDAILLTEDNRFYSHSGIDIIVVSSNDIVTGPSTSLSSTNGQYLRKIFNSFPDCCHSPTEGAPDWLCE